MSARPGTKICRANVVRAGLVVLAFGLAWSDAALADIHDSFITIPGKPGHYQGADHKDWIRVEADQWISPPAMGAAATVATAGGARGRNNGGGAGAVAGAAGAGAVDPLRRVIRQNGFNITSGSPPIGTHPGSSGKLIVMMDRNSPDLALLSDACAKKVSIPELNYSEWSGPVKPANFPAFWQYKLKNVEVADCPVAEGAADQAFVLAFQDIEWLNYDINQPLVADKPVIPDVKPIEATAKKKVKSYLITWLAIATDMAEVEDQCPVTSTKPSDADVFRYMTPDQVAEIKAKAGEKGLTPGPETEMRGPHQLNVEYLPGIVPDTGIQEPQSTIAYGIDLDGNDGKSDPPSGFRKHKNYNSPDGRTGIDNQLYTTMGCMPGFRGKKGYRNQTDNARRADGNITTLVEVSGITDEKNDNNVEIALIHSMDKPIRDVAGSKFIANFSFRATDDPKFTLYNMRVHGRIVNGVVISDVIPKYSVESGQGSAYELVNARIRLEPQPDGSMRGYLAGYQDWRYLASNRGSGYSEGLFSYQFPALYYALKRNADGLKDPVTGEYNGISTVYEMDTVPAFVTAAPPKAAQVTQDTTSIRKNP